jgi:hypothetical protein
MSHIDVEVAGVAGKPRVLRAVGSQVGRHRFYCWSLAQARRDHEAENTAPGAVVDGGSAIAVGYARRRPMMPSGFSPLAVVAIGST